MVDSMDVKTCIALSLDPYKYNVERWFPKDLKKKTQGIPYVKTGGHTVIHIYTHITEKSKKWKSDWQKLSNELIIESKSD